MNLGRIFANAIARRVAYIVVALVVAAVASLFGMGDAYAQTCPAAAVQAPPGGTYQYEGQALAACQAAGAATDGKSQGGFIRDFVGCRKGSGNSFGVWYSLGLRNSDCQQTAQYGSETRLGDHYSYSLPGCPPGEGQNEDGTCDSCADRSPLGPGAWFGVNADMQMCQDGCTFEGGIGGGVGVCLPVTIDGTVYQQCTSWGPTGSQCSAGIGNGSLAPPDSDGDGTSDGNDGAPNNPGSGGGGKDGKPGEDGSSSCGGPDQPACEADGSNSGSGKGNTSGGGGDCNTPPSSTGDAILAQIAFQTWATRCAIAGNANTGGGGNAPGDGNGDGQPGWTEGNGPPVPEDTSAQDIADAHSWGLPISADLLDTENIFGNASCPALPAFSFFGVEIDTASFSWWCTLVSIMRAAILIMSAFTAIQILLGRF